MNDKRSHEFLPFGIKIRTKDTFGRWGHWRTREPFYWQEEQRDAEFAKLKNNDHTEYKKVEDITELEAQLKAMERIK